MPNDDILCPTCGHSMAFHKFDYGSCDAPLGGLTSKNVCGCGLSISAYILNMQLKDSAKELEQLRSKYEQLDIRHQSCMDEIVNSITVLKSAQKRIEFLDLKLRTIKEILDQANPIEKANPVPGWFGFTYRSELIKIINDITLELEKDMNNG